MKARRKKPTLDPQTLNSFCYRIEGMAAQLRMAHSAVVIYGLENETDAALVEAVQWAAEAARRLAECAVEKYGQLAPSEDFEDTGEDLKEGLTKEHVDVWLKLRMKK